jgi:hypothetical protein
MNTLRVIFVALLLSASSAYADSATHWSAAIGTGRASSSSNSASVASQANADRLVSSPYWSASIGTGRATQASHFSVANSSTAESATASAHWSSRIGTGRAAESSARIETAPAAAARVQP